MNKGLNVGGHTIKAFWLVYLAKLTESTPPPRPAQLYFQTAQQKGEKQWVYRYYYSNCKFAD